MKLQISNITIAIVYYEYCTKKKNTHVDPIFRLLDLRNWDIIH